jgi:hypothetical protein
MWCGGRGRGDAGQTGLGKRNVGQGLALWGPTASFAVRMVVCCTGLAERRMGVSGAASTVSALVLCV